MTTKTHFQYKLENDTIIPSVTTVLDVLAKPALIHWAWKQGRDGQDYTKVRDDKASIGSLAHYLVLCDLKGITPDTSNYTKNQIDQAETCLLKWWDWKKQYDIEVIYCEQPFVSEYYRYGGTPDLACKLNGEPVLIDIKTGKDIYEEYGYQLAAYRELLIENKFKPDQCRILRIGRDENEGFEEKTFTNLDLHWQVFLNCLEIYNIRKQIKGEK